MFGVVFVLLLVVIHQLIHDKVGGVNETRLIHYPCKLVMERKDFVVWWSIRDQVEMMVVTSRT